MDNLRKTRFRYTLLDENNGPRVAVGTELGKDVVIAVKFANQGSNSSVKIGEDTNAAETIGKAGAAEISFGVELPCRICHEFYIEFKKIVALSPATHCCLMIETIVENC